MFPRVGVTEIVSGLTVEHRTELMSPGNAESTHSILVNSFVLFYFSNSRGCVIQVLKTLPVAN